MGVSAVRRENSEERNNWNKVPLCTFEPHLASSLQSSPNLYLTIPHYLRQVTVVAQSNLSLTRTSRSLFASLSSLAPKAAGPALVLATRSTPLNLNRYEWNSRSSTVNSVQQTRYASNKDRKNKNMPPKKVVKEEPVQLGRPGNSLNAGIVCTNVMYVLCTTLSNTSR